MTAINFDLQPELLVLFADTLMTDLEGQPAAFVTKAYPIPHLSTIITGRGSSNLIAEWAFEISCRTLVSDFDMLVEMAQPMLQRGWAGQEGQRPDSSTVFVFGWSATQGQIEGYAFRSGTGFEPELLEYGRRCCPGLEDTAKADAIFEASSTVGGLMQIMIAAADENRPLQDPAAKCFIGGEMVMHTLSVIDEGPVQLSSAVVHHFPDRDSDYASALTRIQQV